MGDDGGGGGGGVRMAVECSVEQWESAFHSHWVICKFNRVITGKPIKVGISNLQTRHMKRNTEVLRTNERQDDE